MTQAEKRMLEANIKLTDTNNEMLRDISILIRYIRGNKELRDEVRNIIRYYDTISSYKKNGKWKSFV